jgi:hypothetical protein
MMLELTAPYFAHSSHCKFSNLQSWLMQHGGIPLKFYHNCRSVYSLYTLHTFRLLTSYFYFLHTKAPLVNWTPVFSAITTKLAAVDRLLYSCTILAHVITQTWHLSYIHYGRKRLIEFWSPVVNICNICCNMKKLCSMSKIVFMCAL